MKTPEAYSRDHTGPSGLKMNAPPDVSGEELPRQCKYNSAQANVEEAEGHQYASWRSKRVKKTDFGQVRPSSGSFQKRSGSSRNADAAREWK